MVRVVVDNCMQDGYSYELIKPEGEEFDPRFRPELTPQEMLAGGVFGGLYLNDPLLRGEYPCHWLSDARLSDTFDANYNRYGAAAGQSLAVWQSKGWVDPRDPRGWFEWYCRYYCGRRIGKPWDDYDGRQIRRWANFGPRHATMLRRRVAEAGRERAAAHCQALYQWSYDPELVLK